MILPAAWAMNLSESAFQGAFAAAFGRCALFQSAPYDSREELTFALDVLEDVLQSLS